MCTKVKIHILLLTPWLIGLILSATFSIYWRKISSVDWADFGLFLYITSAELLKLNTLRFYPNADDLSGGMIVPQRGRHRHDALWMHGRHHSCSTRPAPDGKVGGDERRLRGLRGLPETRGTPMSWQRVARPSATADRVGDGVPTTGNRASDTRLRSGAEQINETSPASVLFLGWARRRARALVMSHFHKWFMDRVRGGGGGVIHLGAR